MGTSKSDGPSKIAPQGFSVLGAQIMSCLGKTNIRAQLLYQASRDGWSLDACAAKTESHSNILFVAKLQVSASVSWE